MNNIKLDFHYVKTITIVLILFVTAFFYFTGNINLSNMSNEIKENDKNILKLKSDYSKSQKKLKKFTNKINTIDKKFILEKKKFGIYKFMQYLDANKEIYGFKYKVQPKAKKLTSLFFYYEVEFTFPYKSREQAISIMKIIGDKYYNNFETGNFHKNKFNLKYRFYGKK